MSYDKLKGQKQQIKDKFTEEKADWILEKYLPHLKRGTVKSRGSQANYLQAIKKILEQTTSEIQPWKLPELSEEELKELNTEILDNIQKSVYRYTEGVNNRRRKRHQWVSWKQALTTENIPHEKHRSYIPDHSFEKEDGVQRQADTKPEDLPSPQQMQEFVNALGQVSGENTRLRNQSLALLLWDKGPRIGEALQIQMQDVSVHGKQVKIFIEGNKKSSDRTVEVFQGRKTLKDWIQRHPTKDDPESYLFCNMNHHPGDKIEKTTNIRGKFKQAHQHAGLAFKVDGEPCHIFRKAMDTAHLVNEWATWEQLCTWKGKSPDSTKPDYVLMATSDVDAAVAEKIGVDDDVDREVSSRLKGEPLLPLECTSCDSLNRCYHEVCQGCGKELPENTLPKGENFEHNEEELEKERLIGEIRSLKQVIDSMEDIEWEGIN